MKKIEVLSFVNMGGLSITANDLDASHAYKVIKFKKAVKKVFDDIIEFEKDALKEAGIEDGMAFDKERKELSESGSDPKRLEELNKQFERFIEIRNNAYDEDAELEGVKALPFEQFHLLQQENKNLQNKPLNAFETILEGVLWNMPEEGEE
jgi:hypothetical protein